MAKSQKLRIGLVFDDSLDSTDGVAQHVKTLGAWLTKQGHDVCYLVGETEIQNWAGGKVYSLAKNIKVSFNGNNLSMPLMAKNQTLAKVITANQFDVLHIMMPYSPLLARRIINLADDRTAIVGTFHIYPSGKLAEVGSKILKLLIRRSISKISYVISVSAAAADFAKKTYRINSIIVPNPIDISRYKMTNKLTPTQGKIVFLGRLVKRKGAYQLIEAFALLSNRFPEARLTIAGRGQQLNRLKKLSRSKKIDSKIDFAGYISEDQKPALLASAEIACFPSLNGESFGIILVEAMAANAGVVVGGDNPGYRSVLGGQPKLLVDPSNAEEFANSLFVFLTDAKLREKMHKWQQQEVQKYDINVVGQQIESVYQSAIARLGKKSHNNNHG